MQPQVVQHGRGILHHRWGDVAQTVTQVATADDQAADHRVQPFAHAVQQPGPADRKLGEAFGQVADRMGGVGAKASHGTLDPGPIPVPGFALGVSGPNEQLVVALRVPGHQHEHRVGLREAGQPPELARLTKLVIDVVVAWRLNPGGHHQHGVATHDLGHLVSPRRKHLRAGSVSRQ